ncbi:hypothetical protein BLA6860_07024 [Burkholderia lata]|nr:hypothetical protein BLA6860_07024 [Burkholderia lata]
MERAISSAPKSVPLRAGCSCPGQCRTARSSFAKTIPSLLHFRTRLLTPREREKLTTRSTSIKARSRPRIVVCTICPSCCVSGRARSFNMASFAGIPSALVNGRRSRSAGYLLGTYEIAICAILEALGSNEYVLVDLGAADGIFGIGLVRNNVFARSLCFEMDDLRPQAIQHRAAEMGLADRVAVYSQAATCRRFCRSTVATRPSVSFCAISRARSSSCSTTRYWNSSRAATSSSRFTISC